MVRTKRPSNRGYEPSSGKAAQTANPVYLRDRDGLRKSGQLKVVDPETAIKIIRQCISAVPLTHYYSSTLPPGLPPRWAQLHLELLASKVIPALNREEMSIKTIHDDR
jgi:hypothetical protein